MGVSTDATLCYGVLLGDDTGELPWDGKPYDGDVDEWWLREVHSFTSEDYDERWAFQEAHPCPVELVNGCSADYATYILSLVSAFGETARRGYPEAIDPAKLVVTPEQRQELIDFCQKWGIEAQDAEPKWWLSSYWG